MTRPATDALADDTGLEVDALGWRARRVQRPVRRGGRDLRRQRREAGPRDGGGPPQRPHGAVPDGARPGRRRRLGAGGRRRGRGRHRPRRRAAPRASATTRSSCPPAVAAGRSPRCRWRRSRRSRTGAGRCARWPRGCARLTPPIEQESPDAPRPAGPGRHRHDRAARRGATSRPTRIRTRSAR